MSIVKKTIFAGFVVLAGAIVALFVFVGDPPQSSPAHAIETDNVDGWAWNDTIGWISFNCTNDSSCAASDYGVHIDEENGGLSGHAWNDKVGWISFERSESGNPPGPPNNIGGGYNARFDITTGEIIGWAKILSMGNDGWLKLRKDPSDSGVEYGATSTEDGNFLGWVWNGNTTDLGGIGWISLSCENTDDGVTCGTSDYEVFRDPNPVVKSIVSIQNYDVAGYSGYDYCLPAYQDARTTGLAWDYYEGSDPEQEQTAYEVQVSKNSGFGGGQILTFSGNTNQTQIVIDGSDGLDYSELYYWRVRVWDASGQISDWSVTDDFTTPESNYPDVDFTHSPTEPRALQNVDFTSTVAIYNEDTLDTGTQPVYLWTFTDANETTTTTPNPTVQFYDTDNVTAALTITDPNTQNYTCTLEVLMDLTESAPIWREIKAE